MYDSEIRRVDEFLRDVFENVPRAWDAGVVFTSDHGEELRERGALGHGSDIV